MAARQSLCYLLGINPEKFIKLELLLLEATILIRLHKELIEIFKKEHDQYFRSIKLSSEIEEAMLETNFIRLVINDIFCTGEYTLEGMAFHTHIHKDVLWELATGLNTRPSAESLLKVIELHISVRKDLYDAIKNKLLTET